jgi:thiamine monophosphate synthase
VHDPDEARACAAGVDYLIAGTVFATASKPSSHALLGEAGLAAVVRAVDVPVLAIGGMTPARMAQVAAAGASGVAGIGLFLHDSRAAVRAWFDTISKDS